MECLYAGMLSKQNNVILFDVSDETISAIS